MIISRFVWTLRGANLFDEEVNAKCKDCCCYIHAIHTHSGIFGLRVLMVAILCPCNEHHRQVTENENGNSQ